MPALSLATTEDPAEKEARFKGERAQLLTGYGYGQPLPVYFKQPGDLFLGEYLAGNGSSKLFIEVRKKLRAAYTIGTTSYVSNSFFLISIGISKEKIAVAFKAIRNGVKAAQKGKVDKDVSNKAKVALKRNYQMSADRQDSILTQMPASALRGCNYTFVQRTNDAEQPKIDKLIDFSQKLCPNESYCLR